MMVNHAREETKRLVISMLNALLSEGQGLNLYRGAPYVYTNLCGAVTQPLWARLLQRAWAKPGAAGRPAVPVSAGGSQHWHE